MPLHFGTHLRSIIENFMLENIPHFIITESQSIAPTPKNPTSSWDHSMRQRPRYCDDYHKTPLLFFFGWKFIKIRVIGGFRIGNLSASILKPGGLTWLSSLPPCPWALEFNCWWIGTVLISLLFPPWGDPKVGEFWPDIHASSNFRPDAARLWLSSQCTLLSHRFLAFTFSELQLICCNFIFPSWILPSISGTLHIDASAEISRPSYPRFPSEDLPIPMPTFWFPCHVGSLLQF